MAYTKKTWKDGDIIYDTDLNNMENGIASDDQRLGNLENRATTLESEVQSAISINNELAARVTKLEAAVGIDE